MSKSKERVFVYILMGLILIQPLLDLMCLNDGSIGEIFGFTIPTLVRMVFVAFLGVMSFGIIKFNKKHLFLVGYALCLIVYFIFHHLNAQNFHSLVPGDFGYSMIGEAFYIVRMCIPIAMMYFVYNSDFKRKEFDISVTGLILIMGGIEIVTNIFKVALGSYSENRIEGNIFDWFMNDGTFNYSQLASKGWFFWSIVSTVLVLVLPYIVYRYIDTKKKSDLFLIIVTSIALFMFGTKATSFSIVIVLTLMTILYLFSTFIKREYKFDIKICLTLLAILIGSFVVLKYSPAVLRMRFNTEYQTEMDEEEEEQQEEIEGEYHLSEDNPEEIIKFFDDNYEHMSIQQTILTKSYPYQYDPIFWYKFRNDNPPSITMQNRIVQEAVFERVQEINNNPKDKYLGIGFTRTSNIYNLERDFLYQYYSMGSVGATLLVGPYIFILLFIMALMLIKFKKHLTLLNCSLVLGIGLTCFLAYYSGNTLETLGVTIVLGTVCGYLLKINLKKEKI